MTHTESTDVHALQADIVAQRAQLAQTVDALGNALDVKARAKAKVAGVRHRATTDTGAPRPELLGAAAGVILLIGLASWWRHRH